MSDRRKLTTVKVKEDDFIKFKQEAIKENFTFRKLVDRSLHLYNTDSQFKKLIQEKNQ